MTPALAALASASADWSQEPSMISVAPSTTSVRISATQRAPRSCQIDFAIRFPVPLTCRTRLLSTRRVVMLRTCLRWRLLRSREGTLRRTGLLQGIPSSPLPFPFSSFGSMVRLVISVPGAQSSLDYGGRFFHLWLDLAPNVPLMPDEQCDGRKVRGRDRKSTRLNSSHVRISYAVFCLKKKKKIKKTYLLNKKKKLSKQRHKRKHQI